MGKIGIVTLFGYQNYGNRLQMYATQKIYEKLGYKPEIIRHDLQRSFKSSFKKNVYNFYGFLFNYSEKKIKKTKEKRFKEHAKNNIIESEIKIKANKIPSNFHENYSYFSVGSDQIWSPVNYRISDYIFLKFAPKYKRIALAPSISRPDISENIIEKFKQGFNGFPVLSVRENEGKELIKKITKKDAEVLVDPTMILTKNEWIEFSENHMLKNSKKNILTYFLGDVPDKAKEILDKYSKNDKYEIIELNSLRMKKYYDANPSEWVDFVKDTNLFLTDSFHGVAFALVLETSFAVYERIGGKAMNSRITTILKRFNLEKRFELDKNSVDLFKIDFSNVESILAEERTKVINHLSKTFNIINEIKNESA